MAWTKQINFEWWNALLSSRAGRSRMAAGGSPSARPEPPNIRIVGQIEHLDFRDALATMRRDAVVEMSSSSSPELIVIAQSRPDMVSHAQFQRWQRDTPLAGIVSLLGSWCEGETRVGKPWKGAHRVYWYDFPEWWRRQMRLRNVGRCPDWARVPDFGFRISDCGLSRAADLHASSGLIVVRTPRRETAAALSDVLTRRGYSTVWQRPGTAPQIVTGAVAGIWDGGQLDDCEAGDLARFCARMNCHAALVTAMLDFPRWDRLDRAMNLGAAVVLGKPWMDHDLIATVDSLVNQRRMLRAA